MQKIIDSRQKPFIIPKYVRKNDGILVLFYDPINSRKVITFQFISKSRTSANSQTKNCCTFEIQP